MRDITSKPTTLRSAIAVGRVRMSADGVRMIRDGKVDKGNVAESARIAALMAVKQAPFWLPHCHPIPVLDADLELSYDEDAVLLSARVRTIASTGVEMEALAAVSAAALCIYDMMKPHVADMEIEGVKLAEKVGGKSQFGRAIDSGAAVVLVLSDTVAGGRKPDTAGRSVADGLRDAGFDSIAYEVLPDEPDQLRERLDAHLADHPDLIVTVGGTGVGPRDRTVETVRPYLTTELPGLMEAARSFGQARTPYAMLSRGIAGMVGGTVVLTFPGSRRGAEETLAALLPGLVHLIEVCRITVPHTGGYT